MESEKKRLLIVDDEENMRHMLKMMLSKSGYEIVTVSQGFEALDRVRKDYFDFVLCDLKMPKMGGMEFLEAGKNHLRDSTVIVMSAYGSINTAIEAMKLGAYDFISKPFKADEVQLALRKAEERESLRQENYRLRQQIQTLAADANFDQMIGKSKAMQYVFNLAEKVAQYDTTVLITGESGTGKELIARGIHYKSERRDKPFVPVNCGGIPENLLESEFFGYAKGAFTGADRNKKGLFEEADGGTLFLDEIGELPITLQVKLLRVLQESEVRPVGSSKARKVDVRVLAATARDLAEEAGKGSFRQDLFYRLNVMPIKIPPLRERTDDIALLCQHFIGQFSESLNRTISAISTEAMNILLRHQWPGNVRELENVIERAAILTDGDVLLPEHFPMSDEAHFGDDIIGDSFEGFSLKEAQKVLEKKLIIKALTATGGNRTKATQLLEISHPSLLTKIKAYNISM